MSLEHGGRADKEGNTYENRFLARLFLQLINEEFQYIQVASDLSRGLFLSVTKYARPIG